MKLIKLTLICLLALFFCYCNQNSNKTNTQKTVFTDSIGIDTSSQTVVIFKNLDSEFSKVYTMKKKDSTVIGDIYVKFGKNTIFSDLFIINNGDTLYSIKKNVFFKKNGVIDDAVTTNIYGYTFHIKGNDYFYLNTWNKNNKCEDEFPLFFEWNYDDNIIQSVIP